MRKVADFSDKQQLESWRAINDVVMGGCSSSDMQPTGSGTALFSGEVSLENSGGFASVRSDQLFASLERSSGLKIRFRGDGKRYKLNLRTDISLNTVNWQVRFDTADSKWQEQQFQWQEFRPTRHGREVPDLPALDPTSVVGAGLLIADRQEGPFRLEIAWLEVVD